MDPKNLSLDLSDGESQIRAIQFPFVKRDSSTSVVLKFLSFFSVKVMEPGECMHLIEGEVIGVSHFETMFSSMEDVPYCESLDLYDMQLVACWNHGCESAVVRRFDAVNDRTFDIKNGEYIRQGPSFSFYKEVNLNHPDLALHLHNLVHETVQ